MSIPRSSAWFAVSRVPLRSAPSTITTARDKAAINRFRAGNRWGSAGTPGGYSLTSVPVAAIRASSSRFVRG